MTDPATGQTMAVPGWVDVTAEVYAAVPAGVTLVPDSMFALYTNQEEILCPDDIPERGLHCAWRKEANNNLPAAGITYMYACGTEGPRFLLQNGGENTAIVTADFVQEGVKQKVDGSLGQWPIRCPFGEVKLPPGTVQPDGNINPSVLTITNEFDNCAGAATDQKTIFAHYGNKPIYYPSGTKCPDGSPAPSPAGICYGCSLEKPPPLMGLSVIPAVCGNVGGKMVCNMMLEWVTRYVEGVVTW